ncbi:hypothetical protein AXG93_1007s1030 [Marchantia polymorpha subsp. ruderalis]|uniref:Uncharacterized protein n=1 Tax=Marchantia polymorpha subsp. ruderalis TaxID=1480154 RepID=A0A176VZN1_MARPO|nr:hypothetical protein AXG93_1007s1030 [Marchantia polymorpha subsp. ruderalis]
MRARPKKKAQRYVVVLESSESSVAMFEGTISLADEDVGEEEDLCIHECGTSGVQNSFASCVLWVKEMECKVLGLNLVKEKELREEEELRTKDLQREIATMKTERMELQGRIAAWTKAHNEEMQSANELMASLAEETKKHEANLASWAKRLTECETAKSSKVKCRLKLDVNCDQLQD